MSREEVLIAVRRACVGGRQPAMEELAAAAGVGVRTLYRLFGSRQALLREAGCAAAPAPRQLILDAALEQVGRHGLAELSMDDLATAAGVSRATVYRLFPGKAALFDELVKAYSPWAVVSDVIDAMPEADPGDVIPAVVHAMAHAMEGRVGLLLQIVFELVKQGPDVGEGVRHGMARGFPDLARYLNSQMQAGRLRRIEPILAFQLLAGPVLVHLLTRPLAMQAGFSMPPEEVIEEISGAWLRAMAPEGDEPVGKESS